MQALVQYSDSDESDKDSISNNKRKLSSVIKPPHKISNTFSKIPLKVSKRIKTQPKTEQFNTNAEATETSFIYFPVILDDEQHEFDVDNVFKTIKDYVHSLNKDLTVKNLSKNLFTLSKNELHISITYNFTTTRSNLDKLINDMKSKNKLKSIKFPIIISFDPIIEFLPNSNKSKYFAILKLSPNSIETIKPFIEYCNTQKLITSQSYDINFLHVSLAEINTTSKEASFSTIEIASTPSVALQSICITKGRTIIPLFQKDPLVSSTDAR